MIHPVIQDPNFAGEFDALWWRFRFFFGILNYDYDSNTSILLFCYINLYTIYHSIYSSYNYDSLFIYCI